MGFGYEEHLSEICFNKIVCESEKKSRTPTGRLNTSLSDTVKNACKARSLEPLDVKVEKSIGSSGVIFEGVRMAEWIQKLDSNIVTSAVLGRLDVARPITDLF